jgi:hypothetical protein
MNKRIRELEEQATETVKCGLNGTSTAIRFNRKKFAELLICECANRASWAQDTNEADIGGEILKHFGVEE